MNNDIFFIFNLFKGTFKFIGKKLARFDYALILDLLEFRRFKRESLKYQIPRF